jgi:putative mRNA 3-end processing factor
MTYDCRFLGAAEDIGRLGFTLETQGKRFLYDYGIAPDKPPQYPLEAPAVDQMFLTHAHLDHSGMVPWLVGRHDGTILTTRPTAAVSELMHHDSLKIARSEGFPQPFSDSDIASTREMYEFTTFGVDHEMGDNLTATFHSAGHIPGAAQVELRGDKTFVFTGDLFTEPQRLVQGGEPVPCDVLAMETTYAGREHPPRAEVEEAFLEYVAECTGKGGIVLVAAFAVGRAQEIAMVLSGLGYNVWLDGMARKVADIFRDNPEFLLDADEYAWAMNDVKQVYNHRGRSVALQQADVIITTSGMMQGGPILYYLDQLRNDKNSGVAISGYQVSGTNGRRLWDTGEIDLDPRNPGKKVIKPKCQVKHFDFSAHAGHKDLVKFAKATGAEDIILFHGDNREQLAPDLEEFATVHMPMQGDHFKIE